MIDAAAHAQNAAHRPLSQRRALVTGAGRGLGRAIAVGLADAGATVTLLARTARDVRAAVASIEAAGGRAIACVCDVTDEQAVGSVLDGLPTHDVVVNCAGANQPEPFVEVDLGTFDRLFALNVRAVYAVTQYAVRRLIADSRPGVVVNITSQMGHVGAVNRSVYCASKHAVEGLTKALAVELAPASIRVVSVAPTFVETPMTKPMFEDARFHADVLSSIPLGRLGTPRDVASAVVFLAGDGASMITGSSLLVDGGWTAR